jgi:N-carbamoylputrescine amidase
MSLKIALVQQPAGSDKAENLARAEQAYLEAARAGAGLIAFPELAFTRFYPQVPAGPDKDVLAEPVPGPTTDLFCRLAGETGTVAVINLFERAGAATYDSSPVIDGKKGIVGVTRMVHIMEGPGFHEQGYYAPGEGLNVVHTTSVGNIGVAICYDRHFPEYMRALRLMGAELVVIPQAGVVGEWAEGMFEAEVRVAAFQNGYYAALVNRVGREERLEFSGESFVVDPDGAVIARAPRGAPVVIYADLDFSRNESCHAALHFLVDRRPDVYRALKLTG